jgi:hypothetical protein
MAPQAALTQLRQPGTALRRRAAERGASEGRQPSQYYLCEVVVEAGGYSSLLVNLLPADVLRRMRKLDCEGQWAPTEIMVPVVAGDGGTATMASLAVTRARGGEQGALALEPADAFAPSARDTAARAAAAARRYAAVSGGGPLLVCTLTHPEGVLIEGESLGPAVFVACVLALRGLAGTRRQKGIALIGTLGSSGGHAVLGSVRSEAAARAKYAAVPPDMLAVHSARERGLVAQTGSGASTYTMDSFDDFWPLLGHDLLRRTEPGKGRTAAQRQAP